MLFYNTFIFLCSTQLPALLSTISIPPSALFAFYFGFFFPCVCTQPSTQCPFLLWVPGARELLSKLSFLVFGATKILLFSYSCSVTSGCWWPHGLQHTRLSCPSPSPGVCWNSCPLNRWCHPTISSSVAPFSSCLQSFPASGCFPMS